MATVVVSIELFCTMMVTIKNNGNSDSGSGGNGDGGGVYCQASVVGANARS